MCGDFPKPYVISPGRVAYKESEVETWKASRGDRDEGLAKRPPISAGTSSLSKATGAAESACIFEADARPTPPLAAPTSQIATQRPGPVAHSNRKRRDSRQIMFDF